MKESQTFTRAEVAQHNGKINNDIWIIIDNTVYDVTHYIHEHPGGGDLITEWAGKDASKEYESIGHSGDASRSLKNYRIGVIGKKIEKELDADQIPVKTNKSESDGKKKKRRMFLFCG